jgi:hypothetical protein
MKRQSFYHLLIKLDIKLEKAYLSEILSDLLGVEKGAFPLETAYNIKKMHPFIDEVWMSEKEGRTNDSPNQFVIDRIKTKKP